MEEDQNSTTEPNSESEDQYEPIPHGRFRN